MDREQFACGPSNGSKCTEKYTSRRGLSQHQTLCKYYKLRQDILAAKHKERTKATVRKKAQPISKPTLQPERVPTPPILDVSMDAHDQGQIILEELRPSPHTDASDPPAFDPPSPQKTLAGRPIRRYRLPARYQDLLPDGPTPVQTTNSLPPVAPGSTVLPRVILHVRDRMRTDVNLFGLLREYPDRPSYDPDSTVHFEDLSDYYKARRPWNQSESPLKPSHRTPPWPFENMSTYLLMDWMMTGSNLKSVGEVSRLVKDVIGSKNFNIDELATFNTLRELHRLDSSEMADHSNPFTSDGWTEHKVEISIPNGEKQSPGSTFVIPGLHRRSLSAVLKAAISDITSLKFHFSPFKRFSRSPSGSEQRCYDEAYTSDAWLRCHNELQLQPNEPSCKLEKVVLGLMFWSDSTHLTNFGTAKVWPLYMYIGNLSKYFRNKLSSGACHHVAYIPSIPDNIQDSITNKSQKQYIIAHCRRELMHAVWGQILDDEFITSYRHGFVMPCLDGVWRRFYPRIFSYSADYPEKVLLAGVRNKGDCPCPRCLVNKRDIGKMGQVLDLRSRVSNTRSYVGEKIRDARDFIFKLGYNVVSAAVERLLSAHSWVPTLNVFAEKLGVFGFDPYAILVVDLMHEFELGVWKAVFAHLIRILYAAGPSGRLVSELDKRFRQIPTFGVDTIRKFANNASEMKKMAARNFEDLLQCAMPVFDGLLPSPFNEVVITLLYRLAEWHALAKLRMHTEATVTHLENTTKLLGSELRRFRKHTCSTFSTVELPKEAAARARKKQKQNSGDNKPAAATTQSTQPSRKPKMLSNSTYKLHSLGDYVHMIREHGATDSYSTQSGELEHRRVKKLYGRTNKKSAIKQITILERRETRLLRARRAAQSKRPIHAHHVGPLSDAEPLPYTDPAMHHHMSDSRRHHQDAFSFARSFPDDPATKDFIPRLKDHLLGRLCNQPYDGDQEPFSDQERKSVHIVDNRIYSSKVLRVNYTTYDIRRDQDSVNPRTRSDIMVLSREDDPHAHPYWYARVLGIFHLKVLHLDPSVTNRSVQHMEVLWVRWFGLVPGHQFGSSAARLPKIGFVPDTDPLAFGFLDPSLVIRGCHLVPAFNDGRTTELLTASPTAGRRPDETDDWAAFFVNIFVDRDMYMRHKGGGVGHCAIRVDGNTAATSETDMEVEQENNEAEHDLDEDEVQFNDSDEESDTDLDEEGDSGASEEDDSDADEAEDEDDLDMEEYEDELEDY